jgi:hypothetical protein
MDNIFREQSRERVNAPEELNDYIHITTPALWFVVSALLIIIAGFLIWGIFFSVEIHNEDGTTEEVHPITFVLD